jgi:alkylhydroperoxidase/carboxymuconolactone decarboxylase family protein YurZ
VSYSPVPDTPLADTLVAMTADSLERSDLPDREIMLVRLAALAAVGAPPISYTLNAGAAASSGLTLEDAQGVLIAVAPVIGTPRTVEAAAAITEGLGLALALIEAALEEEEEEAG